MTKVFTNKWALLFLIKFLASRKSNLNPKSKLFNSRQCKRIVISFLNWSWVATHLVFLTVWFILGLKSFAGESDCLPVYHSLLTFIKLPGLERSAWCRIKISLNVRKIKAQQPLPYEVKPLYAIALSICLSIYISIYLYFVYTVRLPYSIYKLNLSWTLMDPSVCSTFLDPCNHSRYSLVKTYRRARKETGAR